MAQLEQVRDLIAQGAGLKAQLWYDSAPPDLTDAALLSALQTVSDVTEPETDSILTDHPGLALEAPAGVVALVTAIVRGDGSETKPNTGHTFDWSEADEALRRCEHSLVVVELAGSPYVPAQRANAFFPVLQVLVEHTRPAVIGWPNAEWVSNPAAFDPRRRDGVFNVRMFGIESTGAIVMDTVGLTTFDLPDVQCHFQGADPNLVAGLLFQVGGYLLGRGDIIADGDTVSPPNGKDKFTCKRELALVGPTRPVIDVHLGRHAAGGRN